MNNKVLKVHIDMDDTLLAFSKAYNAAKTVNPEQMYPQSQYGFFANLELLPFADLAYKYFTKWRRHEVYFLTAPSVYNPFCYTEKRVSIEKHFGFEACKNLIFACDKSMIRGDVLIDDRADSNKQNEFEGDFFLFGSEEFPNWGELLLAFDIKYHGGSFAARIGKAMQRHIEDLQWRRDTLDARITEQKLRLSGYSTPTALDSKEV